LYVGIFEEFVAN